MKALHATTPHRVERFDPAQDGQVEAPRAPALPQARGERVAAPPATA